MDGRGSVDWKRGKKTGIRREEGGKGGTFKTKEHLRGCVET